MNKIKMMVVGTALGVATTLPVVANTTSAHAKDPCFFSGAEFNNWRTEKSGNPGWGDTLAHVENDIANCTGTWDATLTPHNCPQDDGNMKTWRTWPQSDGDQVWIAFADYGFSASPRFRAHCEAGIYHPDTNSFEWKERQN
jgi:hypothetical protein